jgi:hypothetical protein
LASYDRGSGRRSQHIRLEPHGASQAFAQQLGKMTTDPRRTVYNVGLKEH